MHDIQKHILDICPECPNQCNLFFNFSNINKHLSTISPKNHLILCSLNNQAYIYSFSIYTKTAINVDQNKGCILYTYMPYLTLWDKISQNLDHLKTNSQKIFQISQNFQAILQHILWRNKHKSHFVVFITSFLHLNKGFWLFLGSSKVIFVKIPQNFIKSPLKITHRFQSTAYGFGWLCWGLTSQSTIFQSCRDGTAYGMYVYIHVQTQLFSWLLILLLCKWYTILQPQILASFFFGAW